LRKGLRNWLEFRTWFRTANNNKKEHEKNTRIFKGMNKFNLVEKMKVDLEWWSNLVVVRIKN